MLSIRENVVGRQGLEPGLIERASSCADVENYQYLISIILPFRKLKAGAELGFMPAHIEESQW